MSIESIAAVATGLNGDFALAPAMDRAYAASSFSSFVSKGLNEINEKIHSSDIGLQKIAIGDTQSLHQVMIHMEEARLSFQLLMQVRNRVLEAYQDVMKMQV